MLNNWVLAYGSVAGRNHTDGLCQDAHFCQVLPNGCGVAVVCDGAGSARYSQVGAQLTAEYVGWALVTRFTEPDHFLTPLAWRMESRTVLKQAVAMLRKYATGQKLSLQDLACTVIALAFSPHGVSLVHIGDGRAGYRNGNEVWHPLFTPTKGEEANITFFLTSSPVWKEPNRYIETAVVQEPVTAFCLLSDGCESHSFEVNKQNGDGRFHDPNRPYDRFFEPLIGQLKKQQGLPQVEINSNWHRFLHAGTSGLRAEPDDKTMIFGVSL
jgi:hypothetical protein